MVQEGFTKHKPSAEADSFLALTVFFAQHCMDSAHPTLLVIDT